MKNFKTSELLKFMKTTGANNCILITTNNLVYLIDRQLDTCYNVEHYEDLTRLEADIVKSCQPNNAIERKLKFKEYSPIPLSEETDTNWFDIDKILTW
jgi:hypothetical protein